MRAMGPGSVASLLKIALDVAYFLLWAVLAITLLVLLASLFVPIDSWSASADGEAIPLTRGLIAGVLGGVVAFCGGFVLILDRLRRIFVTLTRGDPFRPENVRRLREIGVVLAVLIGGQFAFRSLLSMLLPGAIEPQGVADLMIPVFSLLVIFVLAEVFREGARLRRDAELTI